MQIKNQQLTVHMDGDTAIVTVTFTVMLLQQDLRLDGGFSERVDLVGPLFSFRGRQQALPLMSAVHQPNPTARPGWYELYRERVFEIPRYPVGPFTTTRINGRIEIRPGIRSWEDLQITNEGVLPPRFTASSALSDVGRIVVDRVRRLLGI